MPVTIRETVLAENRAGPAARTRFPAIKASIACDRLSAGLELATSAITSVERRRRPRRRRRAAPVETGGRLRARRPCGSRAPPAPGTRSRPAWSVRAIRPASAPRPPGRPPPGADSDSRRLLSSTVGVCRNGRGAQACCSDPDGPPRGRRPPRAGVHRTGGHGAAWTNGDWLRGAPCGPRPSRRAADPGPRTTRSRPMRVTVAGAWRAPLALRQEPPHRPRPRRDTLGSRRRSVS